MGMWTGIVHGVGVWSLPARASAAKPPVASRLAADDVTGHVRSRLGIDRDDRLGHARMDETPRPVPGNPPAETTWKLILRPLARPAPREE